MTRKATPLLDRKRPAMQRFSTTAMMLMMQHQSPVVELIKVRHLFGCESERGIQAMAKEGDLPVPIFKTRDSQKAPWLIHVEDLATYLDNERAKAADMLASYTAPLGRAA